MAVYDLTVEITPQLVVFPGDPQFKQTTLMDVAGDDQFKLCQYEMSNHLGTHIDFPAHVIKTGNTSDAYPLDYLAGPGIIAEYTGSGHISAEFIESLYLVPNSIVFFKTKNTHLALHEHDFTEDFCALEPNAAKLLVEKKAKVVGIDYLSIDAYSADSLSSHHILLGNNVLIVENLMLRNIAPGNYNFTIAPLKVKHADGLPARVFATDQLD